MFVCKDQTESRFSTYICLLENSETTSSSSSTSSLYKDILELVLLCTINEEPSNSSSSNVYLAELASSHPNKWDTSRVDQALFERLRISDPSSQLISITPKKSSIANEILTENRCLYYLSGCYQRLSRQRVNFFSNISFHSIRSNLSLGLFYINIR